MGFNLLGRQKKETNTSCMSTVFNAHGNHCSDRWTSKVLAITRNQGLVINTNQSKDLIDKTPNQRSPNHRADSAVEMKLSTPTRTIITCVEANKNSANFTIHVTSLIQNASFPGMPRITVIYRTSSDFWTLHVSLLGKFGKYSKLIPFLESEPSKMTVNQLMNRKKILDHYLKKLILLTKLNHPICYYIQRFFEKRVGDHELPSNSKFIRSFLSLESALAKRNIIKHFNIVITHRNNTISWKESKVLKVKEMIRKLAIQGLFCACLYYKNEFGNLLQMSSDLEMEKFLYGTEVAYFYTLK
jgi:hypothetical protein